VKLQALAVERPTALRSFERDPAVCHRSILIEAVMPEAYIKNLFA
jgi:hypothetical protein